jgi:hypothetical protein
VKWFSGKKELASGRIVDHPEASSAQETVETRDFGGFWHFAIYDAAAAVAVGMWKAAFCASFKLGGRGSERGSTYPYPPSERRFHSELFEFPAYFGVLVF